MYQTLGVPSSNMAAKRICFAMGTSASSMYSSMLNAQALTLPMDVLLPSNTLGLVILNESGIFDGGAFGSLVSSVRFWGAFVLNSDCLWGTCSDCLWGTFVISLWSWYVVAASGEMPRARNSLERGILTVVR